jgi:hypothetical protein
MYGLKAVTFKSLSSRSPRQAAVSSSSRKEVNAVVAALLSLNLVAGTWALFAQVDARGTRH